MTNRIEELTGLEKDQTIHIISSGPSLDFYNPQDSNPTICIDYSYQKFSGNYLITRYHHLLHNTLMTGAKVITSELDFGKKGFHKKLVLKGPVDNLYLYDSPIKNGSVIIDAINLAVILGAKSIILHGVDYPFRAGTYEGYPESISLESQEKEYPLILKIAFNLQDNGIDIKFDGITNEMILPYSKRILKNETRINQSSL